MKLNKNKIYFEIEISEDSNFDTFLKTAENLKEKLNIKFIQKIDNLDSYYWDFIYEKVLLTLHYNYAIGVSIFPISLGEASDTENIAVEKLYTKMKMEINL